MCPNLMTWYSKKGTGKGYQRIKSIKTFEFENTKNGIKCCDDSEKEQSICSNQGHLPTGNATPNIAFADKSVVQCDVPVVENTFVHDCK